MLMQNKYFHFNEICRCVSKENKNELNIFGTVKAKEKNSNYAREIFFCGKN